ncbi:hypothetical protein A9267_00675 [Shewanella sp. UCD-FRSSP16_17]|uniref:hypothetical protein n=1 Tax=Shewanella sp. UCD-FRSSP16_17 TaxID=1853256 RepID=UPI0007EEC804|nr:hypothetical protein [Shewanella sp. UCD-FRSSP16_17]OBT11200.1 hypothetical protein A9267_00675 [Shewanella sp. UCD-FRSSP16_17]
MLKQKLLALAISSLCISGAYAEVNQEEFTAGLVTASAEGNSPAQYALAQMQNNPADSADILGFALIAADSDMAIVKSVLAAALDSGMDPDEILAIALANGIDPSIVSEVIEETQTAAGAFALGAAPTPGALGLGGGSGGGGGTISGN